VYNSEEIHALKYGKNSALLTSHTNTHDHVNFMKLKETARCRVAVLPSSILNKELAQLDPSDGTELYHLH
jgi:hypothetical protein